MGHTVQTFSYCDGFRIPARSLSSPHAPRPGGRRSKAAQWRKPRKNGRAYRRAIWGFRWRRRRQRRCRLRRRRMTRTSSAPSTDDL